MQEHFDVTVVQAHGMRDAMSLLREGAFDLVTVNRVMDRDGTYGIDIIQAIKANSDLAKLPASGGEVEFAKCYGAFRDWPIDRNLENFLGDCYFARPESVYLEKRLDESFGDLPLGRFEVVSIRTTALNADDLVGISHVKALTLIECFLDFRLCRPDALPKLNYVVITECQLSAVATQSLSSLTELQELYISQTLLPESELMEIARLKGLKGLVLESTNVSVEAQKSLQKSLPRCRVICR